MGAHVKHVIGFIGGILIAAVISTQLDVARRPQPGAPTAAPGLASSASDGATN